MCAEDFLNRGWIVPSESNYSPPVISVQKEDETVQLCYDYQTLNAKVHPD